MTGEKGKLKKILVWLFLSAILIATPLSALLIPKVYADAVQIILVSPTTQEGNVGDNVQVIGYINRTNGLYKIWFGEQKISEAYASGNSVDATFLVPSFPKGNYSIILQDVAANINATTWFYIDTAYHLTVSEQDLPHPRQLQENDMVELWVNVTGGEQDVLYHANITVKNPSNETSWTIVSLPSTPTSGERKGKTVFPTDFFGSAHTNFTGMYTVALNETIATSMFFVGLTNSSEYHRFQNVNVRAAGYEQNEEVSINVRVEDTTIFSDESLIADERGFVQITWLIPPNAPVGTYSIHVASKSNLTVKTPPDIHTFIVPGFPVTITPRNLAGESVPNIPIYLYEGAIMVVNATSNAKGLVHIQLELGNYVGRAVQKEETVGERVINVTGPTSLDLACNLTNLQVSVLAVINDVQIPLSGSEIHLTPGNQTLTTNAAGIVVFHSLLPAVDYVVSSSRYNQQFDERTIPTLLVNGRTVAFFNETIINPTLKLQISTINFEGVPISGALVEIRELLSGVYAVGYTNFAGELTLSGVFGKYRVKVYDENEIKLNETIVDLFRDNSTVTYCDLYGLTVSVKVVDYFHQPISNLNVTLQQAPLAPRFEWTQSNGLATFSNVTGGVLSIATYLSEGANPLFSKEFTINESATIEIKADNYVVLASFLVKTSMLTTALIIIIPVLLVSVIEIFRHRRLF